MEFFIDFGLFALLLVAIMAFMGVITTKIAELFGGKKGKVAYDHNLKSKEGWNGVGGKKH